MNREYNYRRDNGIRKTDGPTVFGHIMAVIGITVGLFVLFVVLVVTIIFRGPSEQAAKLLTLSANETSAMKFLPGWFLSDEQVDSILNPKNENTDDFTFLPLDPAGSVTIGNNSEGGAETTADVIEIVDVKGSTFKGKMLLVHDPSLVRIVSIDTFGGAGLTLGEFCEKYNAVGATNAGGFEDENGKGKGGIPDGLVIRDGSIVYGSAGTGYRDVIGFDAQHVLHVGDMSGQQALNEGIVDGISFSIGPVLIKDGVKNSNFGSGINPRSCIGQCADGTVLMLAVEGRFPDSLGATFEDVADLLLEYGAVNAGNLDGGSSSGLYYMGERVTRSCSVIGDRGIPTAIVAGYDLY